MRTIWIVAPLAALAATFGPEQETPTKRQSYGVRVSGSITRLNIRFGTNYNK